MTHQKSFSHYLKVATPYLLVAPVIIYYAIFWLRPVVTLVVGSFTALDGSGFTLENFQMVFNDPSFWPAIRNTTIIVVFSVTLEFIIALILALLINMKFPGSGFFLFIAMIPMHYRRWLLPPCGKPA